MKIQIKDKDIPRYRAMYAVKQKYICPICGCPLGGVIITLDHCHTTGLLRSSLCSTCNISEGKTLAGMRFRARKTHLVYTDPITWLRRLADYLEYHRDNPSAVVHPTFDTKKGKQVCKKKTRKKKT